MIGGDSDDPMLIESQHPKASESKTTSDDIIGVADQSWFAQLDEAGGWRRQVEAG